MKTVILVCLSAIMAVLLVASVATANLVEAGTNGGDRVALAPGCDGVATGDGGGNYNYQPPQECPPPEPLPPNNGGAYQPEPGPAGQDGADGANGQDGRNGRDGRDGRIITVAGRQMKIDSHGRVISIGKRGHKAIWNGIKKAGVVSRSFVEARDAQVLGQAVDYTDQKVGEVSNRAWTAIVLSIAAIVIAIFAWRRRPAYRPVHY